jgi:hypothetical protein
MVLEDVIIVLVLGTPEKMANMTNAQDVKELENVSIVEVQEDWLYGSGLLNDLNIFNNIRPYVI